MGRLRRLERPARSPTSTAVGPARTWARAVGYRFSSPTSVELLLGSLTATTFGWPDERWSAGRPCRST